MSKQAKDCIHTGRCDFGPAPPSGHAPRTPRPRNYNSQKAPRGEHAQRGTRKLRR